MALESLVANSFISAADAKGEINLKWEIPAAIKANAEPEFTTDWKTFIFKKTASLATNQNLIDYLAAGFTVPGMTDDQLAAAGLMVYRDIPNGQTHLEDFHVLNGVAYGYRALIRYDEDQHIGVIETDAGNTNTTFKVDLPSVADDDWKGYLLRFESGTLTGQTAWLSGSAQSTQFLTTDTPFTAAPSTGDAFVLYAISKPQDITITAALNVRVNVVDGKTRVIKALEKVIDAMKSAKTNDKTVVGKHIKVYRGFSHQKGEDFWVVVTRTPGQTVQRYLDSTIGEYGANKVVGDTDVDALSIEWITTGKPLLRDKFTDLMRSFKPLLRHYLLKMGNGVIIDAKVIMSGDKEGQLVGGENGIGGTMMVVLTVENRMQYGICTANEVDIITEYPEEE